MSEISGFSPLVITPQMRAAQAQRMERVHQALDVEPGAVAQLNPRVAAAQFSYFNQVQDDIGTIRNGSFPSLPPIPGMNGGGTRRG